MKKYKVVEGDNLTKIASSNGVDLAKLISANPQIADPNLIYPGQEINIPSTVPQVSSSTSQSSLHFVKGKNGKAHEAQFQAYANGANGTKERPLAEPVPTYFFRPGDAYINSVEYKPSTTDNNTMIIFGRDRSGEGEVDSTDPALRDSLGIKNYGDYMGAGAIDIVVGRGAPFPVYQPGTTLGPLFQTKENVKEMALTSLVSENDATPYPHPGILMDAARIYISQFTDVDDNFGIQKQLRGSSTIITNVSARTPCSSIMIKADRVRMHSRQDIKIVTGGERYLSSGNEVTGIGGIHLIAGNLPGTQQPIPLGHNLTAALSELVEKLAEAVGVLFNFTMSQIEFNSIMGTHVHNSPFGGLVVTPSCTAMPAAIQATLDQMTQVGEQCAKMQINLEKNYKNRYLRSGGPRSIKSSYNTTN